MLHVFFATSSFAVRYQPDHQLAGSLRKHYLHYLYTLVLKELHPYTVYSQDTTCTVGNPFPAEEPFRITLHLHYFRFAFPVDQTGGNPCQGTLLLYIRFPVPHYRRSPQNVFC